MHLQPGIESASKGNSKATVISLSTFGIGLQSTACSSVSAGISVVIHTAAPPSHDWAAREPFTDFDVNAGGTLNLLESCRCHAPQAVFVFTSTNKVYGDTPNRLPLIEEETRWEIDPAHPWSMALTRR